jgi:thymidine kinase
MGELHLILGPMFAGKTTSLINKANSINKLENKNIFVINHSSDERYSKNTFVTSHDNLQIPCVPMLTLNTIFENDISNINYIFINEGQFFPDLYDVVKKLLFEYKKIIYICGLDGDYKQEPFPNCKLLELIPLSNSVEKIQANCSICKQKAPYTKRIINSNDIFLVGGSEMYQPVCLEHL